MGRPGAAAVPPVPPPYQGQTPYPYAQASNIGNDAGMRMLLPVGRSWWAIAAGYMGLFSLLIFPAPIAIILGIIAIIDIKKHPGKHGIGRRFSESQWASSCRWRAWRSG